MSQSSEEANRGGTLPRLLATIVGRRTLRRVLNPRALKTYASERGLLDSFPETVPTMSFAPYRAIAGFLLATLCMPACVVHEAEPAFRASVLIDDRGISIPLPPPSLIDEPEQEVEVQGEVVGLDEGATGLVVRIVDSTGGAELDVPLEDGSSTFHGAGLTIDLSDNCLELWLVDTDGREGEHSEYEAVIDESDGSVTVVEGC